VTKVPPDRQSTHALYEELERAGRRMAAERRPARRRAPWRSGALAPALSALLAILVVGGGVAVGTKVFTADDDPLPSDSGAPADVRHAPSDAHVAQATSRDPVDARARWGLRLYPNGRGDTCVLAGRLQDGRLGRVLDGRFSELPAGAPGFCTDLEAEHAMVVTRGATAGTGPRALLYGAVDRTVTGLSLGRPGAERPVTIAPDGTYLVVGVGAFAFRGQQLVIARGDDRRTVPLQP
jgi:hypothetical protein